MVKYFDTGSRNEITGAIRRAESRTSGEIRVHVRSKCRGDALEEAKKVFQRLRMHKTAGRNGVLIYLALDSHAFAIVGDSGIHEKVGESFWSATRDKMRDFFSKGEIKEGIIAGVLDAGEKLKAHFPVHKENMNELSDELTGD